MKREFALLSLGVAIATVAVVRLPADQLELQNGDHYTGKIVSVTADSVVLDSEVLGKITVPRSKVTGLTFGTNVIASTASTAPTTAAPATTASVPTNLPTATTMAAVASAITNGTPIPVAHPPSTPTTVTTATNLSTSAITISQIRQQMLAGSPEAAGKYDEMVAGLLSGSISVSDLQKQARESADQLRELKKQLGPDADEALDGYLQVLDNFVKETGSDSGQ